MQHVEGTQVSRCEHKLPSLEVVEALQYAAKATANWMNQMTDSWASSEMEGGFVGSDAVTSDVIFQAMLQAWHGESADFMHDIEDDDGNPLIDMIVRFEPA